MKKNLIFAFVVLTLSIMISACGASGPTTSLTVDMTDFMFNPADYVVPGGETITLELVNNGAVKHEFVIMNFGADIGDDINDEDESFKYGETDDDIRYGCLAYGFIKKGGER